MKKFIGVFLVIITSASLLGQQTFTSKNKKAIGYYQEALGKANESRLDEAILILNLAIKADPNFIEAYLLQGELFSDNGQVDQAIVNFKKAIELNPDFFPAVLSNLANIEFNDGKYDDALVHVKKFLSYQNISDNSKKSAEFLLKSCQFASEAIRNPVPFQPKSLGPMVNTHEDQYWPTLSADEQTLIYTALVPINPNIPTPLHNRQEDFYFSTYVNGEWSEAKPLGPPINTPGNEGAQTISADGKVMIFTGCNRKDGYGSCDLYISHLIDNEWSVPKNIGPPINTPAKETQPALSPDGNTLYFSSNRPGGKGGLDIWMSKLQENETWSEPVNLGDSINTPYDEESPFIHPDNQTLYFSSNGWPGLGRFDLFMSKRKEDGTWSQPKNLGYPINTNFSEEGMIVNAKGNTAYYSSNRVPGRGRDLYTFELYKEMRPTTVSYMKGKVFDSETHQNLRAHFELIDLATAKTIMDSWSDNYDGSFLICIPAGKDYALNVNKNGYLFYSDNFTMTSGDYSKPFLKDIPLQPIKIGEKVVMKNIFFDVNSFDLKPTSQIELNRLITLLKQNPDLRIEIGGYTDNVGKSEYNKTLSEKRAKSVLDYLTANGISASRLISKGFGDTQPIDTNSTDEGRSKNRRTEFRVIKN